MLTVRKFEVWRRSLSQKKLKRELVGVWSMS
jgi:hypothetical protein